jgi:hypothetical protein
MKKQPVEKYIVLFLPYGIASLFQSDPVASYFIAWLGSFAIFYMSISGWLKPLPDDRTVAEQLMRPLFLVQIIFAGYMACSSIFYFSHLFGYDNFNKPPEAYIITDHEKIAVTAQCQRYYVLGHAAFVTGISVFMKYPIKRKYYMAKEKLANMLLITAFTALLVSILSLKITGLQQLHFQFNALSFIAGTLALAFAIPLKKIFNTIFCLFLYFSNFYAALTSGFKEPIILSVLVLGIFLYPNYKKIVLTVFIPALLLLFFLLPAFNQAFRASAWGDDIDAGDAYKLALNATINDNSADASTWGFLVYRLSEMDMFTTYVESTPKYVNYYGLTFLKQAIIVIIPRVFWPDKPITEYLVMERVYAAGVTASSSNVSAKPTVIVDAYLSGGVFGIIITLFIYGAAAQLISMKAEQLFGGYILGTALIFSGLFQIFWRGLSFEFLIGSVFWSYISMLAIFMVLRATGLLTKI